MASVGSSTSSNSLSNLSAKTGIGGLASGMDIDELVEQMTATSRQKILKQQQNLQKLEWKQTTYRSVTTALNEFQGKYLDVLSSTNLRSASFFNIVKATSSSDAISVTSTSSAVAGKIKIDSVTQLATNQKITMADDKKATKSLTSANTVTDFIGGLKAGDSIRLNLDGKVRAITFDSSFIAGVTADPSSFEDRLQNLIDNAYGITGESDKVISADVDSSGYLTFAASGSKLTLNSIGEESTTLTDLGFTNGQTNVLSMSSTLADLNLSTGLNGSSQYQFNINGINFKFDSSDKLSTVINRINGSDAGVTLSYSTLTDQFTLTAKETGAGNNIYVRDTGGNLMSSFGLTSASGAVSTAGVNAILSVNGQTITRSSNTFEVDGAKVTLNSIPEDEVTITMKDDATSLKDTIKSFVEDYNAMIELANGLVKEEVNRDYQPLSDEQKADMTETQIKAWEDKAKSGILRGDSLLKSISSKLHSVVTGLSVNGFSLYSMGITSAGYTENGKLQVDETKLQKALETKGSEIRELFTSENGIGTSLNEIIIGATKTSGVKGTRGSLVEVAGVKDTLSDTESSIFDQMKKTNKSIKTLKTRLTAEESRLWRKFSAMENAINSLNSQNSMISQFFSSGS